MRRLAETEIDRKAAYLKRRNHTELVELKDAKTRAIVGYRLVEEDKKAKMVKPGEELFVTLKEAEKAQKKNKKLEIRAEVKAPLRGQGQTPDLTKVAVWTEEDHKAGKCGKMQIGKERTSGVTMVMTRKGLQANPRRKKRQRIIDRQQTKKGYVYGIKIGGQKFVRQARALKNFIGVNFGKAIIEEKDGKVVAKKYMFPAKTKHLRTETEEHRRHKEKNPLTIDPSKSNKQRFEERKVARAGRT